MATGDFPSNFILLRFTSGSPLGTAVIQPGSRSKRKSVRFEEARLQRGRLGHGREITIEFQRMVCNGLYLLIMMIHERFLTIVNQVENAG